MKEIPLTQGKFAFVDDEEYKRLSRYKWSAHKSGNMYYATCTVYLGGGRKHGKFKHIKMHRLIMNPPTDMQIDHINCDGLDNRKVNLRICTLSENIRNSKSRKGTSRFKGVYWIPSRRKWRGGITFEGKKICLPRFKSEIEAAKAYDRVAIRYFGEFAYTNFPRSDYE